MMMIIETCMHYTYNNNNKWMFHNSQVDDVKVLKPQPKIEDRTKHKITRTKKANGLIFIEFDLIQFSNRSN